MSVKNKITNYTARKHVEMRPGLVKTNLSYNGELMLCHFTMKKGAKIELHNHAAVQNGYIISGRVKYEIADAGKKVLETGFVDAGSGYVWDSMEYHSFEAVEDAEFIECFGPIRPEYVVAEDSDI
jgi:mannose-6-phosphate isomerase-like protein (cupin superfamily)